MAKARLAIIGGGATGTLLAIYALRHPLAGQRIVLIEPGRLGRGIAYRTEDPLHLLNVSADRMSAFAQEPDHFLSWLKEHAPRAGTGFVPRGLYGRYLEETLRAQASRSAAEFEVISEEALGIERDAQGARVVLRDRVIEAETVAVATGHHFDDRPPATLSELREGHEYFGNIWCDRGLIDLPSRDARVLILGTGLTMVDAALTLVSRGHREKIVAISRRGLLPQPFRQSVAPVRFPFEPKLRLSQMVREISQAARQAERSASDWRAILDGLRSEIPGIWSRLPEREQRRFLRHVRPFWDSHRHRLQPDSASRLHEVIAWKKLEFKAGRVLGARVLKKGPSVRGIQIEYYSKALGTPAKLECDVVLNCTGPEADLGRSAPPLLASLLESGLARLDHTRLGIETDSDGRIHDRAGQPQRWLVTLGPLRRGMLWESTAIAEIRMQAEKLADLISRPQ